MKITIKNVFAFFLLAAVVASCSKSDDDGAQVEIVNAGSIKVVITLESPLEDWNFNVSSTMTPALNVEDSEITYVNTSESRTLAIAVAELQKEETTHTFLTSENAKAIRIIMGGTRGTSEEEFNYKTEVFLNDRLQSTQSSKILSTESQYNQGFDWSIENGYKKI